jgi:hypothetical protein
MVEGRLKRRVWGALNAARVPRGDYRFQDDPEQRIPGAQLLYSTEPMGSEEEEAFYAWARDILRQNGYREVMHWIYRAGDPGRPHISSSSTLLTE